MAEFVVQGRHGLSTSQNARYFETEKNDIEFQELVKNGTSRPRTDITKALILYAYWASPEIFFLSSIALASLTYSRGSSLLFFRWIGSKKDPTLLPHLISFPFLINCSRSCQKKIMGSYTSNQIFQFDDK